MFRGGGMPPEVALIKNKQTNRTTTKQSRVYENSYGLFPGLRQHSSVDGSLQVGLAIALPAWETQHQLCLHSTD